VGGTRSDLSLPDLARTAARVASWFAVRAREEKNKLRIARLADFA
jgi:hypothetical protein